MSAERNGEGKERVCVADEDRNFELEKKSAVKTKSRDSHREKGSPKRERSPDKKGDVLNEISSFVSRPSFVSATVNSVRTERGKGEERVKKPNTIDCAQCRERARESDAKEKICPIMCFLFLLLYSFVALSISRFR